MKVSRDSQCRAVITLPNDGFHYAGDLPSNDVTHDGYRKSAYRVMACFIVTPSINL